jgi:Calx-beta domain-containing protein/beta-propeller uncharacterized protein DUF5122
MRHLTAIFVAGMVAAVVPADSFAGPNANAKIQLHLLSPTTKDQCTRPEATPSCAGVITAGGLYPQIFYAYVLVTDGDATAGVAGAQFGIHYNPGSGMGVNIFSWTLCASLEFQSPTPMWPSSGGGNLLEWDSSTRCQRFEPGGAGTGVVTAAGYFYCTAYTPDTFTITPRPVDGYAKVADCSGNEDVLASWQLGSVGFGGQSSYNPCGLGPPTIRIDDPQVLEGNTGPTTATFTVTLSHTAASIVTVDYATADGTATAADNDYLPATGTVTFQPGQTSRPIAVTVNGDHCQEADETFSVNLSNPTGGGGATIGDGQGTGKILNDDVPPTIGIDDRRVLEGNTGPTTATFTVTLSAAACSIVTVDYATADGTATVADNDYLPATGTVTFQPGQTSRPIAVTVNGDTSLEADEIFSVTLSNPAGGGGATIADALGTGTIQDDDNSSLICPGLAVTNGEVRAMVESGGTIYIGGSFTQVGPMTGHGVPVSAATGLALSGFPVVSGPFEVVTPDGSGGWFIGGEFTSVGGVPRSGLAHILADNTVAAWDPNPNSTVYTLAVSGGTVYVGGYFTSIGGEARNRIAALDAGTGHATAWNPNANVEVTALAAAGGTIYAGGNFSSIGGQARSYIAALDAGTGNATPWNPNVSGGFVDALVLDGGTVYVGGNFTGIGASARNRIGAIDAVTGLATNWDPNSNGLVNALAVSGGSVYVGGAFTSIGGQTRNYIAALDAGTGNATTWDPNANSSVSDLAIGGSSVYAVGNFTQIGGSNRNYAVALDVATGSATSWNPNANYSTRTLAVSGNTVYVGGSMTSIGAQTRNHIAALNTTTGAVTAWYPVGGTPDGAVLALAAGEGTVYAGGTFTAIGGVSRQYLAALDATTGANKSWSGTASGSVNALALSGGTLYAGGAFASIGGATRDGLAALNAITGVATAWNPNVIPAGVLALAVDGSTVYAGGDFIIIGGQFRDFVAALDITTGLATAWDPSPNGLVEALAVSGGTVYVGGEFGTIGGQSRNNIAAVDATGLATSWDPSCNGNDVYALAVDGGTVYVGGEFGTIGGQSRSNIAAVDAGTALARPWNPNASSRIRALALVGGSLYVGGNFTSIGNEPRSGVVCIGGAAVTGVPSGDHIVDSGFMKLGPNPARGGVEIEYALPEASKVRIRIYDLQGRLVAQPVDEQRPAGTSQVRWDGDGPGGEVVPGIYFVRLEAPGLVASRKFVIVR